MGLYVESIGTIPRTYMGPYVKSVVPLPGRPRDIRLVDHNLRYLYMSFCGRPIW